MWVKCKFINWRGGLKRLYRYMYIFYMHINIRQILFDDFNSRLLLKCKKIFLILNFNVCILL